MIFKSLQTLISRFKISIFILIEFKRDNLPLFDSSAAAIVKLIASKQKFFIFGQIPNLSLLGIFDDNK